jgi:formylglycine-generating enzyme required for sulfatase activity
VSVAEFRAFLEATGYRPAVGHRFLVGTQDAAPDAPVTGVSLTDARAYAAWAGARLPDEFEWQLAADAGFERREPAVWNLTESEHDDGITRFVMLKGGSAYRAVGSDWYADGGEQEPSFSLKFLLPGLGVERSSRIGFRLAWDGEETR